MIFVIFSFLAELHAASVASSTNELTSTARKSSSELSTTPSTKQAAPAPPPTQSATTPALPPGARVCILQPSSERTAGFALSGKSGPPFIICQIEKASPAEKAGLLLNDALLSIDGKSVANATYEETVKLIKEGLQQQSVELVVRGQTKDTKDTLNRTKMGIEQAKISVASTDSANSNTGGDSSNRGTNPVEEYQSKSKKELVEKKKNKSTLLSTFIPLFLIEQEVFRSLSSSSSSSSFTFSLINFA